MKTYLMLGLLLLLSGLLTRLIISMYGGQEQYVGDLHGVFTTTPISLPVSNDGEKIFNTATFETKPIIISP